MHDSCFLFVVLVTTVLMGSRSGFFVQAITSAQSGGVIGKSQNCTIENASWPVPPNVNPDCYRCFCKEGVVRCEGTPKCENIRFCPVIVYNETKDPCCPRKCKGCKYLDQEYANDEQWPSTQDSCRMLTCKGGVVTMARMECVTLCPNAERMVGYCCPLCPRASIKNISSLSASGEALSDPCVQCSCTDRWCHCFKTACPTLDCPVDYQFTPADKCCPECRRAKIETSFPTTHCAFQGVVYKHEAWFRPDACTLCKCQDGTVICQRFVCPNVDCPQRRIYYEPDLCCPRCRDRDPLPCESSGKEYKHGDQWSPDSCTRCKCSNGSIRCDLIECTELQCPRGFHPTQVAGKCCPECEETDGTCTVFGDPHYQTFDGRSFNFQGTCRYVLAKVCDRSVEKDLPTFTVVVQNELRGNGQYAWTRHVSIRLPNDVRVALLPGKKVRLNRKPLKLPHMEFGNGIFSVTHDRQSNVLFRIGKHLKVVWDGNSYVEVTVSKAYKSRMCGLCGNYNDDTKDDLEPANNRLAQSVYSFGQSWRIGSWKVCKSNRDRQYHEKLSRERRRQRRKHRKQAASGGNRHVAPAFLNSWSDRRSSRYDDFDGGDRVSFDRNNFGVSGRFQEFLKLLSAAPSESPTVAETKVDNQRSHGQGRHRPQST